MDEQLKDLRKRILLPWQVQRGSAVWAPWGKSGWSAVNVMKAQRKWAHGMRVKPQTGKETAKGKIPMDRLIKRDPKLKGKDRPQFTPDEVFPPEEIEEGVDAETEERAADNVRTMWDEKGEEKPTLPSWCRGSRNETPEEQYRRLHPPKYKHPSEMTEKELREKRARVDKMMLDLADGEPLVDW